MTNLAIIPARGGSKRIPRKNIKDFLGKPIIAYSIQCALNSGLFDEVMISTDDEEIANCAKNYGATVPFYRSEKASDDFATTIDVIKEVLSDYKNKGNSFENVCTIYPTAPFIKPQHLVSGYKLLSNHNASLPVTRFSFSVWRSFNIESSKVRYQWPEFEKVRSQDLQELFHDAGQWYWLKTEFIQNSLIPENTAPLELTNMEVQDIDTLDDWRIAELKYEYLQSIK